MTARTGMTALVEELRGMCNAGTADYTLGTANYWDDDHLQAVLDLHREDVIREPLQVVETWLGGGTLSWTDYYSRYTHWEADPTYFTVENSTGTNMGTASFTPDYTRGRVVFAADTGGSAYYLSGRVYNINRAAAQVWRQKASYYATQFDFSTDNHSIKKSGIAALCLTMAARYEELAGPTVAVMVRGDINV